jgi:hypothetical protein
MLVECGERHQRLVGAARPSISEERERERAGVGDGAGLAKRDLALLAGDGRVGHHRNDGDVCMRERGVCRCREVAVE